MLSGARNLKAQLFKMAMSLAVCAISGCAPKSGKLPTYMQPELLYLNDRPYSRLYVEVDSVEGVEVPEGLLDELRVFLAEHCSKPGGIEIVRDEPIPLSEARELPMGPASVLYLDGPDPNSGSQPAYMHLFFYDTDTVFKRAVRNPHTPGLCPSAIFYNVDYWGSRQDEAADFIIKHEAGHVLGLCKDTAHGDGAHCSNHKCRMNASSGMFSGLGLLLGFRIERELCADCRGDLERGRSEDAGAALEFKGPFLIRREDGYFVASLPSRHILLPESVEDKFQWQEVLADLKESIRAADLSECAKRSTCLHVHMGRYYGQDGSSQDMVDYTAMLTSAAKDPNPFINSRATALLEELKQEQ